MSELPVDRPLRRPPSHPGELFREILDEHLRMPVAEAARRMKISRQALHAVLAGEASVTADMALRFGRLAGGEPELYLTMQARRDLWEAEERLHDTLTEIDPAD
jgi:addiction module HigA family antidote